MPISRIPAVNRWAGDNLKRVVVAGFAQTWIVLSLLYTGEWLASGRKVSLAFVVGLSGVVAVILVGVVVAAVVLATTT